MIITLESGQRLLFDVGALPAARPDPNPRKRRVRRVRSTSRAAAASLTVAKLNGRRRDVYEYIRRCGSYGATDAEVQLALRLTSQAETPRRGELAAAGLIVDSGDRRETPSGRAAVVWKVPGSAAGGIG